MKKIILLLMLMMIPTVMATNSSITPTEHNISLNTYNTTLPYNGSVSINITSNETFDNITITYNNVTGTSYSWITGASNVNFDNQTEYILSLDYSIPNGTSTGNYEQVIDFTHFDNTTESLTFNFYLYYNITINWSCTYTGNYTFLNADGNVTYDLEYNDTDLPKTLVYNFSMCSEPNKVYNFLTDDWVDTPPNLDYDINTSVLEFNVNLTIPEINLSSSVASYEKSFIIYRTGFTRVVSYNIIIRNESYVEVNDTVYDAEWLYDLEDMTAREWLDLMESWDDEYKATIPDYVVEYINNTEYQNIPLSPELMQKWIQEYNPALLDEKDREILDWKKRYGEEESDSEAMKIAYNAENKRNEVLKKEKGELEEEIEDIEAKNSSRTKWAIGLLISFFVLSGVSLGLLYMYSEANNYDW